MQTTAGNATSVTTAKPTLWAGRVISALAILFLIFDCVVKVMEMPQAVEPTVRFGFAASFVRTLGIIELACLVLYIIPPTSVLGAILMTGYLGGALATQVRAGGDTFSIVFPLIIGALVWGGLYLRNSQLRALVPLQR